MKQPPFLPGGHERTPRILAVAGLVLGLGVIAWLPERSPAQPHFSFCAFRGITGLPCPLCGGTRSAAALLHGDWSRALHLNALAIPAVALLLTGAVVLMMEAMLGRPVLNWLAWGARCRVLLPWAVVALIIWWIPQLIGALDGSKPELLDLRNPIARTLSAKFNPGQR